MPPAPPPLDPLAAEAWSPLTGQPLALVELSRGEDYPSAPIVIGIDRAGTLPEVAVHDFAALVTTCPTAPAPWVSVAPGRLTAQLALIAANIAAAPLAATTFARVLRIGEQLPFAEALAVESLAYSTLLGGDEFSNWRAATQRPPLLPTATELVRYDRSGAHVTLTLSAPDTNNAMNAPMRDALWEGLADVLADPSRPDVTLRAQGRCFSTGGRSTNLAAPVTWQPRTTSAWRGRRHCCCTGWATGRASVSTAPASVRGSRYPPPRRAGSVRPICWCNCPNCAWA